MERLLPELAWRGLLADHTPGLPERLARGPITGYVGFDPTARSLQIGNLVQVMLLAHLQQAGGKPVVLVGGGTGLIGDPSGKRVERLLLDEAAVETNAELQRQQLGRFLEFGPGPHDAEMLNNLEWLAMLDVVGFLRDIGKHFTVNYMLQKESVKSRLDSGISYTEFSYMLLQAYDFLHLFRTRNCELQLGGSDQWGNITAGTELIRRVAGGEAHGLSTPLVTTAGGAKFGKTEDGSVWLDPEMTSPYQFYQFWVNVDDRDAESYLKIFTFDGREEIDALLAMHTRDAGARAPHKRLAFDATSRVHGETVARQVREASRIIFGELDPRDADPTTWKTLAAELPSGALPADFASGVQAVELVARSTLVKSKSEARRLLSQGGISLNGEPLSIDASTSPTDLLAGRYLWLRRGKKTDFIFTAST
jgi:tyrosyl-tRNA synthetase